MTLDYDFEDTIFSEINLVEDLNIALKMIQSQSTLEMAEEAYKESRYADFLSPILQVLLIYYQNKDLTTNNIRNSTNSSTDHEELNDVTFWNSVHEGDWTADDYETLTSTGTHYNFDLFDNRLIQIENDRSVEKYCDYLLLSEETDVTTEEKIEVFESLSILFPNSLLDMKSKNSLKYLKVSEEYEKLLKLADNFANQNNIIVDSSNNHTIWFKYMSGNPIIKFYLKAPLETIVKEDYDEGNELSIFCYEGEIEKNIILATKWFELIGFDLGTEYYNHMLNIKKTNEGLFPQVHENIFACGVKTTTINNGVELRSFFKRVKKSTTTIR
ncbi:hypothetical protein [Paenibacillus sp. MER 99-2]|uniref:hypothetical protein n=1 Tax=Paenibacillus sp. MER 99-2 TaxID=2939572 RepID=UPI00203AAADB|nr:hypothetical protein [Paenibacillus sp. MER 99-2]MCM3170721.1 hypothetical protein [Paenibacillus sp. MER 99-2]